MGGVAAAALVYFRQSDAVRSAFGPFAAALGGGSRRYNGGDDDDFGGSSRRGLAAAAAEQPHYDAAGGVAYAQSGGAGAFGASSRDPGARTSLLGSGVNYPPSGSSSGGYGSAGSQYAPVNAAAVREPYRDAPASSSFAAGSGDRFSQLVPGYTPSYVPGQAAASYAAAAAYVPQVAPAAAAPAPTRAPAPASVAPAAPSAITYSYGGPARGASQYGGMRAPPTAGSVRREASVSLLQMQQPGPSNAW